MARPLPHHLASEDGRPGDRSGARQETARLTRRGWLAVGFAACFAAPPAWAEVRHEQLPAFDPGESRSPDGGARLFVEPPREDREEYEARLWLETPGGRPRVVARFDHFADIRWLPDSRRAVVITGGIHFNDLYIVDLNHPGRDERAIDRRLRRLTAVLPPNIPTLENRNIWFDGLSADRLDVTVSESGLPPGRTEGSFIGRDNSFEIDIVRLTIRAVPLRPRR